MTLIQCVWDAVGKDIDVSRGFQRLVRCSIKQQGNSSFGTVLRVDGNDIVCIYIMPAGPPTRAEQPSFFQLGMSAQNSVFTHNYVCMNWGSCSLQIGNRNKHLDFP